MFTPRDFQLRISRRRTNQKTSRSPVFAIGSAPVLQNPIRPTQLPEAGAHSLELWTACFEQSLNDPLNSF